MPLHLVLVVLGAVFAEVTSGCPQLPHTDGIETAKIVWKYDLWYGQCQAYKEGSTNITYFTRGERKPIESLGNDCLRFVCDHRTWTVRLETSASSCMYKSRCTKAPKSRPSCEEPYHCYTAVYEAASGDTYTNRYRYKSAWFSLITGYTCGQTGSGPCSPDQCFNPFADPKDFSPLSAPGCVEAGSWVVNNATSQAFECQRFESCDNSTFVDLVPSGIVCEHNGTFVPAGTVTWSDACSHTVCDVSSGFGKLVTSFKDKEGCVHGDECIALGGTFQGRTNYTCARYKCRKDSATYPPTYYLDGEDEGCLLEDKCYKERQKVTLEDSCRRMYCRKGSSGKFFWEQELKGCYDPSTGDCKPNNAKYTLGQCVVNRCIARQFGRWKTDYKKSGSCVPKGGQCIRKNGLPGCKHKGRCYAVKSVLTMDACLQYVCYSDDEDLNSGTASDDTPFPVWRARATGCYGPEGCMAFGQQYVDPHTLNTYRCDYHLGGFDIKKPLFHKACVAPSGLTLALGQSVLVGTVWYSCYRNGVIKNPIDRSVQYVPEDHNHTCGNNPDTGRKLYKGEYYFTPEGRCRRTGYFCIENCQYFDQPCTQTDLTPYRHIGDKFLLDGAECTCTQDYEVNNVDIPSTGSLFNTPSLCGELQVTGAACKDPNDDSLHQWGELWEQSRGKRICTCHPLLRQAYCSGYLPDVVQVLEDTEI